MGGARAVVLFNRHVSSDEKFDEHNMTLHWSMVGLPEDLEVRTGMHPALSDCGDFYERSHGQVVQRQGRGWL